MDIHRSNNRKVRKIKAPSALRTAALLTLLGISNPINAIQM
jgi:hypothetical protein